jgi:hypothetical protein
LICLNRYCAKAHPAAHEGSSVAAAPVVEAVAEPDFGTTAVGLFSDIAVRWEHGWELGQIEKMVRYFGKNGKKSQEWRRPVGLEHLPATGKL